MEVLASSQGQCKNQGRPCKLQMAIQCSGDSLSVTLAVILGFVILSSFEDQIQGNCSTTKLNPQLQERAYLNVCHTTCDGSVWYSVRGSSSQSPQRTHSSSFLPTSLCLSNVTVTMFSEMLGRMRYIQEQPMLHEIGHRPRARDLVGTQRVEEGL